MYSAVSAMMRFEDQAISRVLVVTEMYDYLYASGELSRYCTSLSTIKCTP